jgi:hypothetical protein
MKISIIGSEMADHQRETEAAKTENNQRNIES